MTHGPHAVLGAVKAMIGSADNDSWDVRYRNHQIDTIPSQEAEIEARIKRAPYGSKQFWKELHRLDKVRSELIRLQEARRRHDEARREEVRESELLEDVHTRALRQKTESRNGQDPHPHDLLPDLQGGRREEGRKVLAVQGDKEGQADLPGVVSGLRPAGKKAVPGDPARRLL